MKKCISILPVLLSFISVGQIFSISCDKENVIYIGVDNPLTIAVENITAKSIAVKTDNGTIAGSNGFYNFRPKAIGPATIILYRVMNGNLKEIGKKSFRVKRIWNPVFKIGSGKDSISKKELQAQQFVRAELEGSDFDLKFSIESFVVCVFSKDTCKYVETVNKGNKIGQEMWEMLQKVKNYDTILFKEIVCIGPDGKRKIEPKVVTVIE
ncbi:MAG: GldM family protein [Ferruginibacter sp.]